MTFTDDDLRKLKEWCELPKNILTERRKQILNLIARLEAAEKLILLRGTHIPNALITREIETAVWAWRKSKGEGK